MFVALASTFANWSFVTLSEQSYPLASFIIRQSSSSLIVYPSQAATFESFQRVMQGSYPAKSLKALPISSTVSFSFILAVMICRNCVQSIVFDPSLSLDSEFRSPINLFISSFLGYEPRALSATFSYFMSITPDPSASNRSNASFMSFFCFSVSYCLNAYFDFNFLFTFFAYLPGPD